jgi:hypothetical protein
MESIKTPRGATHGGKGRKGEEEHCCQLHVESGDVLCAVAREM